ncbi:MAG: 50S ribosomal protein L21 [Spirochaetaceae bacterium]|nr:MAG: 50S ribosomal protein L21 [Spirochaetaceae bacterium]
MYALVEILGKQYRAEKGSILKVSKLGNKEGEKVEFDSVLLLGDKEKITIGEPYVKGAKISAKVESHGRDRKIIIGKYKKRKNYRRRNGFRAQFTTVKIEDIVSGK